MTLEEKDVTRGRANIGSDTGMVYSVNTLGCIAGSFLTGFLIMPFVGMETAMYIAVAVNRGNAAQLLSIKEGQQFVIRLDS